MFIKIMLSSSSRGFRQDLGNWVCKNTNWVCNILAPYARNSFIFIFASFAAPKQFFSPFIKYWATFFSPIVKKSLKNVKKPLKTSEKTFKKPNTSKKKIYIYIFETGRDYHGQHGWLPKPLSSRPVHLLLIRSM